MRYLLQSKKALPRNIHIQSWRQIADHNLASLDVFVALRDHEEGCKS